MQSRGFKDETTWHAGGVGRGGRGSYGPVVEDQRRVMEQKDGGTRMKNELRLVGFIAGSSTSPGGGRASWQRG